MLYAISDLLCISIIRDPIVSKPSSLPYSIPY